MNYKWLFFCALALSGCMHSDDTVTKDVRDNATEVALTGAKPENKFFTDVFDTVEFLPLETGKQSYLSFIDDVLYFKGNYFIRDNSQHCIFCFDEDGKFKFKIFPRGKAPLELNSITDFTVNTRQELLEVFDFTLGKIVSFDLSGNPVSEKRFNYYLREFSRQSNGDYVVYAPDLYNDKTSSKIASGAFVTDSMGNYKYSFLVTKVTGMYTEPINCLSGFGDSITLVSNYTKDVYLINNGNISKTFRIKYDDNWVQSLITTNGYGSNTTITYRKEIKDNTGLTAYLNGGNHSQQHLNMMFNNLFVMPIIIPHLVKDSRTMVGFVTALDLKKMGDFVNHKGGLKVNEVLTGRLLALSKTMTENDNPVMIMLHLKNRL